MADTHVQEQKFKTRTEFEIFPDKILASWKNQDGETISGTVMEWSNCKTYPGVRVETNRERIAGITVIDTSVLTVPWQDWQEMLSIQSRQQKA